jgi:UDP-glucose 4-epimerase
LTVSPYKPKHSAFDGSRCLITGGLGFLGSNLAIELVRQGAQVTLLDAMIPEYGGNLLNIAPIAAEATVNFCDVRESNAIQYLVQGQDYVFHLAGQVSHVKSLKDPFPDIDINIGGTTVLLEALRSHNPDARVVFSSTRGAYGRTPKLPVDEDHPSNPLALHEISKLAAELIFKAYAQQHGIRSTILRLTNTYGPRSQMRHGAYGVLNYFVRLAMDGETIQLFGDGSVLRDYLYVDDAVEAMLLAASHVADETQVFNVGRSTPTSLLELVTAVIRAAGTGSWTFAPVSEERKAQEPGDFYSDISRIGGALGWVPKIDLEEGLARTVAYYDGCREAYWPQPQLLHAA